MYKDSKKKEKRIKLLATLFILIILLMLVLVFIYETNFRKVDYKDIWGEEKESLKIEYFEETIEPTIVNVYVETINNTNSESENYNEEAKNKLNISDYYNNRSGVHISTYSNIRNDIDKFNVPTSTSSNVKVPNYHTGKIYYYDINEEEESK